jgi:hypothetical protein
MRSRHLITILVLLAAGLLPAPAHAGGVVTVCDEAHLLAALAGGGTVTVACSGVITLSSTITIAADTTVDGSGQEVTISGNDAVRVFTVGSGATLNLDRLTIANGNAREVFHGGGIYLDNGTVNVSNTTFANNHARRGGAIYNYSGEISVNNAILSGNSAAIGGAIFNDIGTVIVSNSTFSPNYSEGSGGGIKNYNGTLIVTNTTFSGVNSGGNGGAIDNSGTLSLSNSTFLGNSASGSSSSLGGAICNCGGTATMRNCTISGNRAGSGGGILNWGRLIVINSTFSDNHAPGSCDPYCYYDGGGIANVGGGTVTVSNSTFLANSAHTGGAINNYYWGTVTVSNSTFSGNSAERGGEGGGIHNANVGGTVTVSNSTFFGNWAGYGGATSNHGALTMSNSTFSGNSATYSGGGISNYGAVTLTNTIVANSPTGANCYGGVTDGGGNLSFPDSTCPGINADPLLGPLQNNGGPSDTMMPHLGSAAIDAGNDAICAADPINNLDQRGVTRPQGPHCDIGAVERELLRLGLPIGQAPILDGNLSDWGEWTPLVLNRDTALHVATQPPGSSSPTPADNSAELRGLWTTTDLYFAIFVRDDAIVNDSQDVWQDDEIELAFVEAWDPTPNNGDTHQYTVNADGRITDFGDPAIPVSIQAVAAPVSGGWNVELRIPVTDLYGFTGSFTAGKTMAFDLGLHDDDPPGGNWDSYMIWAGDSTFNHAGGLLRLDEVVAPTPVPIGTLTSTPTSTSTCTPTPTVAWTATPTSTSTATSTATATATPTSTPVARYRYLPLILKR